MSINEITSKGLVSLLRILSECNSMISKLNLITNKIDDESMKILGEFVESNQYIEDLALSDNKITDKGIEILSMYVIGNTTLKSLHLSFNIGITSASVPYLIEAAKKSHISTLEVNFTSLSDTMKLEIKKAVDVAIEKREVPLNSKAKSASKTTQ